MTPRDFCYWLQGYFEVGKTNKLSEEQVEVIRKHLRLVFDNVVEYDEHSTVSMNFESVDQDFFLFIGLIISHVRIL